MSEERMNIGFMSSKKYLKYAKTMIRSLIHNNENAINLYILSTELSEGDITFFKRLRDNVSVELINIDGTVFDNIKEIGHYGVYAYFRMLSYIYLPENVDRVLWLDLDLIINGNLNEFYNIDFESNIFVGCKDLLNTVGKAMKKQLLEEYGIDENQAMFNSGVLLMNIKLLREENPKLKMIDLANKKYLLRFADQDILNVLYGKRIKYISNKYNFMTMYKNKYDDSPCIIHYAGEIKPDNYRYRDYYSEKFWKYHKENNVLAYFRFKLLNILYRSAKFLIRR